ncbi:MAG TPA: nucleotidyl transferase AbiEii/AbiGii toxin family protein, partial [Opitutaceae bacterium]
MDAFLRLSADERRDACRIAEGQLSLRAASIEKDFWICWTLRELFALPGIGAHLTFKGGTSLSKGWNLIQRFSEDLDLTVDRAHLGFGGNESPEAAPNNNQRRKRLDALHAGCVAYVRDMIKPALEQRIPAGRVVPDPDDELSLLFEYPTAFPPHAYLRPTIKMEFGARSDIDPSETPEIRPYLIETLPDLAGGAFYVRVL